MASPIYRTWAKTIRTDGSAPGYSASWVTAVRGWLNVHPDRVECGDIVILVTSVQDAVLYEARQSFIPVYILAVTITEDTYQFGLNPWTNIGPHLPFPFRRERIRLRYSAVSMALRVALLAYIAYVLYRWFGAA